MEAVMRDLSAVYKAPQRDRAADACASRSYAMGALTIGGGRGLRGQSGRRRRRDGVRLCALLVKNEVKQIRKQTRSTRSRGYL